MLGISANATFSQKAFADFFKIHYPLLSDFPEPKVMKAFGVLNEERRIARRSYIIIDKEGVVRYKNTRPTGAKQHLLSTEELLKEIKKVNQGKI